MSAGASGIGRAIADAFLTENCRVHICDVDDDAIADFLNSNSSASATKADVSLTEDVERVFEEIQKQFGGLDVLVNNAGVAGPTAEIENVDPAEFRRTVDVGLVGNFLCSRRASPMLQTTKGSIINIASTAGLAGCPGRTPYVAAKWGVVGMTKTLAMEMGKHGIRVNAICPGSVEGPRIHRVIARDAERVGCSEAEIRDAYERQTSMRCFIDAQDVAGLAVFLASNSGRYLSGQIIAVDGNTESFANPLEDK